MKFGWVAKYFNNFIEEENIDCEKVNFSDFMIGKYKNSPTVDGGE